MKRLLYLGAFVCLCASAQNWMQPLPGGVRISTFAGLPAATTVPQTLSLITDSITGTACSTASSMCYSNGLLWYQVANPAAGGSGGGVSSAGLALPSSVFSISGSPVTSTGTLTGAFINQTQKTFFAAPNASDGTPLFRVILPSDVPTLNQSTTGNALTATGFDHNPTGCTGSQFATKVDAGGNAVCGTPSGAGNVSTGGTLTSNQVIIGAGTQSVSALGSLGTTTTVLHGNASGAPSFGAVSLANDVTGNLAVSHLNSGTSASSTTFWRGDGTWATPSGSGGTATSITSGPISGLPATCAAGDVYFATNLAANQQLYTCSATNTWTQSGLLGPSGALAMTAGALDIDTTVVCRTTNSCPISALWDFGSATATAPLKKGVVASLPATCNVGQEYFATDATAGQNEYYCTATNTWTQQTGGGGGAATQIVDSSGNPTVKSGTAVGSAVNYFEPTNSATGSGPSFQPGGTDTDIPMNFTWKGNSCITTSGNSSAGGLSLNSFRICDDATGGPAGFQIAVGLNSKLRFSVNNGAVDSFVMDNDGSTTGLRLRTSASDFLLDQNGNLQALTYKTASNCASAAAPAVCGNGPAGRVVIAASATSVVVNTTAVTANSEISLQFDSSIGSALSVTCNTTYAPPVVSARSAGTSFTISTAVAPTTNPACYSYRILN